MIYKQALGAPNTSNILSSPCPALAMIAFLAIAAFAIAGSAATAANEGISIPLHRRSEETPKDNVVDKGSLVRQISRIRT